MKLSPRVFTYEAGQPRPVDLPPGSLALAQVASRAFGDGSHPTTRLCAGAVDLICRTENPKKVLDVGAGTGVLARIARARGAERVVATDIDPEALRAARENAGLDASAIELEVSDQLPHSWGPVFDLVVANILEGPLRELAPYLAGALSPGGRLLISGFTPLQVASLRTAFEGAGLRLDSESQSEGWCLLAFSGR